MALAMDVFLGDPQRFADGKALESQGNRRKIKNEAGGGVRLPHFCGLQLVVEFESELNVPWRLGAGNLTHGGAKAHVGRVVLYVVKGVDEVSSELQVEPLCNVEVLGQTEVYVGVVRTAQTSELRSASAESSFGRVGKVAIVGEPLNATSTAGDRRIKDPW